MKVVVAGAGYAGTLAANRLSKKMPQAEITVINPRSDFVERVRLHQHLAATAQAAIPLSEMLSDGIRTRQAAVDKIGDGSVRLESGEELDFDHLFLAVGSSVSPAPGTVAVATWEGAQAARTALAGLPAGSAVTVVGAGATGIETVAEIAYARSDLGDHRQRSRSGAAQRPADRRPWPRRCRPVPAKCERSTNLRRG